MKKRDQITEELKELHKRYWNSGFCSLSLDQYNEEVKRIRNRWLSYYDEKEEI